MSACYALIETLQAARLINRLCKHWGHKFEVTLNEQEGGLERFRQILHQPLGSL